MKRTKRNRSVHVLSAMLLVFLASLCAAGQPADTLRLQQESPHFSLYATPGDIPVLDTLASVLEANYARITQHLGIQMENRTDVRIYPDVKAYHSAIGYPDAPDWMVGGSWNGKVLMMVSPLHPGSIHTYASLMQVVVHEFVHIAVVCAQDAKGLACLPRWLNEGYAQYEAGQINDRVRKSAAASMSTATPPTWAQLDEASDMEFGNMNGYAVSVTIVDYLVTTYGIGKLVQLIKAPESCEAIYGLPESALEQQWVGYMKGEKPE